MAKIAVVSKKNKTIKPDGTGVDVGLLKVKDGRIQKKKKGKSDLVTGIVRSNIPEAFQETLTKEKCKKGKYFSLNPDASKTNGAPLTTSEVSSTKNRENCMVNPFPEVEKMKIKLKKDHSETQFEKVVIGSNETVLNAICSKKKVQKKMKSHLDRSLDQSVISELADSIADTKQPNKTVEKKKKGNPNRLLDQSVSTELADSIADTKQPNKTVEKKTKGNRNRSLDQSVSTELADSIADTKQPNKTVEKKTKGNCNRSLDQSVSTEDSSVSKNPSRKVKKVINVQTSEDAKILPIENHTDGEKKQLVKANKFGRFEKLRILEEARKKKQLKIDPSGTTGPSFLNDTKINLDNLQPDLDDITDSFSLPPLSVKSKKLSKKTKAANRGSLGENLGDSDTDSDNEDAKEDDAVCKSYRNDFGFDEVVDAVLEEKNREEDREEEQKLQEAANKKKKTERDVTEHERTIEVINVHIKTSKKALLSIFKKFGKVESIRYRNIPVEHVEKFRINQIMKNTLDKNRSSMTAFVKFANTEAAKSALEANTSEVSGHHIIVRPCVRLTPHQQREELAKGCTVFVGNLPHATEEEAVYQHFESCGPIVNISIIRNQFKATGTAFLEFKTKEAAAAALKLNDTELQRRTIRVTKAVRKVKANKKHVQSSTSTNSHSPSGGNGNKPGGRPFPGKVGANKPFAPNKQGPFQRAPGAGGNWPHMGPHKGPHKGPQNGPHKGPQNGHHNAPLIGPQNGAVRPGCVQSRLSRPGQQQGDTTTSSRPSGAFTGNKFDQPQKAAGQLLKKKRTKEEVRKIMLAKKLTFKKSAV